MIRANHPSGLAQLRRRARSKKYGLAALAEHPAPSRMFGHSERVRINRVGSLWRCSPLIRIPSISVTSGTPPDVPPIPETRTGSHSLRSEKFRKQNGIFRNPYDWQPLPKHQDSNHELQPFGISFSFDSTCAANIFGDGIYINLACPNPPGPVRSRRRMMGDDHHDTNAWKSCQAGWASLQVQPNQG